ncbi:hypothetical protein PAXRUDRAFT_831667, partial [Paxillus rubicundulus Ve08.2h10]
IEQWYEQNYPSFAIVGENGVTYDWSDKRTAVVRIEEKRAMQKHLANSSRSEPEMFPWAMATYIVSAFVLVIGLGAVLYIKVYRYE